MRRILLALTALVVGVGLTFTATAAVAGGKPAPKPTIVFVHGAFADASGFSASISALQKKGYTTYAPANPLRGLTSDSEYVKAFLATIPGPVVLVGHSYGGAVITNAAYGSPNVKALVYVAAYALAEGESVAAANSLGGGVSNLLPNVELRDYPGAPVIDPATGQKDQDAYIRPSAFRKLFAADVPAAQAAVMAASQRPATLLSLGTPSGPPAWKTVPSWYLVAHDDQTIPPAAERFMAKRAGAHTVEIRSSHSAMVSHPKAVTSLILSAAKATS